LGLLAALALVVTPYVHINDLVLEALPVLLLASMPLNWVSRPVLTLWGLGAATPVALAILHLASGQATTVAGFGLLLAIVTPVALVVLTPTGERSAASAV